MIKYLVAVILFVCTTAILAQEQDTTLNLFKWKKLVQVQGLGLRNETIGDIARISGQIGTYGEIYSVNGKERRKPGETGRLFLRPTLTLFESFSINFEIFLSTEGNSTKQNLSTFALHPEWEWGRAHAGDFSHKMSKFTLSDIQIRGGGLELYPWKLRFQAVAGQAQKAIENGPFDSYYERFIYAVKLGYGEERGGHFDFNFVRVRDDANSVNRSIFRTIDTTLNNNVTQFDTSYSGITPQENMIFGMNTAFSMFKGKIKFKGELSASAFTSDMFADRVESSDVPEEIDQYFVPRYSTSADYAYLAELGFSEEFINAKFGTTYIGPGYTSLGLSSLVNDKQIYSSMVNFNLFKGMINLQTAVKLQNDNVNDQKKFTTNRNNYSVNAGINPVKWLTVNLTSNFNNIGNNSDNDTTKIENNSYRLGSAFIVRTEIMGYKNVFNTSFSYQNSEARSAIRPNTEVKNSNYNFGVTTEITEYLASVLGFTLNRVDILNSMVNTTTSFSAKLKSKLLEDKLKSSLGWVLTNSDVATINALQLRVSYPIVEKSRISLKFRARFYNSAAAGSVTYREYTTSLSYAYNF